jgi:hypothetical protein
VPLDGGLPHYAGGGVLGVGRGELSLLGTMIGEVDGRTVRWHDVAVCADGKRSTGLSLFASQGSIGVKLVFHDGHEFSVGETIEVAVEPTDDPIRLG